MHFHLASVQGVDFTKDTSILDITMCDDNQSRFSFKIEIPNATVAGLTLKETEKLAIQHAKTNFINC
ncbi:TPA: hypothetical protein ACS7XE_000320 [Providencia alcalifaciens]|uniref:hypothetical protein n=1 Tax=Providencia TaxID=586 RepID=UPI0012B5D63B|nr:MULTISPECIES: hypothetical protein [Providencia]MBC5791217.1 hypothetical protein [Providencia sp. JUb39]MTC32756.1 hypothetical protein [Providencia alcalifaciens]